MHERLKHWSASFAFTLCACAALLLAACAPAGESSGRSDTALDEITASRSIRAGWAPYAPYAELDPATRKPKGFYIEVFERMAEEAGWKVEWVETTWANMVVDLKAGRFDVMAAPVYRTIPRAAEVAFTQPIDYFGLSVLTRRGDNRIRTLEDLKQKGLVIVVTQGEVGDEYATRHLDAADIRRFASGNIALALNDVIAGRADAGIADAWTIRQFAAEHPDSVVDVFADEPFNRVGAGWFVAQDDHELLLFLDTSIDWLISSGAIAQISNSYELASEPVAE